MDVEKNLHKMALMEGRKQAASPKTKREKGIGRVIKKKF
jgi:hypothetical protein